MPTESAGLRSDLSQIALKLYFAQFLSHGIICLSFERLPFILALASARDHHRG
jgi:hypothetical protein